jgi:hypothetical protein
VPKTWAAGLTAETDARVARIAEGHRGKKYQRRTPIEECRWARGPRGPSWSSGLTKENDARVKRNAEKHLGLQYQRRITRTDWARTHSCQRLGPLAWSPSTAYLLGLMATDGCLLKDGRHLDFVSKDLPLVELFLGLVGHKMRYRTRTRNGRKHFSVRFSDVELYRWLANAGLTPRKSLTLGPLEFPDEFWSHVVRGLLDGDGSVAIQKRTGRRDQLKVVFLSASRRHLEWLKPLIHDKLQIDGGIFRRVRKNRNDIFELRYSRADSCQLLSALYSGSEDLRLERKFISWSRYALASGFLAVEQANMPPPRSSGLDGLAIRSGAEPCAEGGM